MQVLGVFFKLVVHGVIIFGLETWVMTPHMGQVLGFFQYRVARQITVRHPQRIQERRWEYPPLVGGDAGGGFGGGKDVFHPKTSSSLSFSSM